MNNRNAILQMIMKFTKFKKGVCQKQLLHMGWSRGKKKNNK